MKMNKKDKCKLLLSCIVVVSIYLGLIFLFGILFGSYGAVLGLMVAFAISLLIFIFGLPVWFKDYIKKYWEEFNETKDG